MPAAKTPAKSPAKTRAGAVQKRNEKAVAAIGISLEKTQAALGPDAGGSRPRR